jgi:hypothetical protein
MRVVSKLVSFSQRFVSIEGGEKNGFQEEGSKEGSKEGSEESQESGKEVVASSRRLGPGF